MSKAHKKQGHYIDTKGNNCVTSELEVFTGLPPQVDGQIRCFCTLSVSQVIWTVPKPPARTLVRVKWWGENGDGVLFRPYDIKKGNKSQSPLTTAKYAVRSGPLQFATYLNDMGSLKLDVLTASSSDVYGQAQVPKIGLLTSSKPINGFFPVVSSSGKKLANLQVALLLEPVATPEDSGDMIPTTDAGLHEPWSNHGTISTVAQGPLPCPPVTSQLDHPLRAWESEVVGSELRTSVTDNREKFNSSPSMGTSHQQETGGKDLLSVIVDRGMKLREAMVISTMPGDSNAPINQGGFSPSKFQMALMNSPQSVSDLSASPFRDMDFKSAHTSLSSDMTFDPALNMLVDPMMDNSLLQDLFFYQTSNGIDNEYQFGNTNHHYPSDCVVEQHISQPARLLGGSAQGHADDPKEDTGNKRPPSRASSLASLNVIDSDAANSNFEKKKVKRKARSRSRSKSTTRSRSRSKSIDGTESQSNTPTKSTKMKKKSSHLKENTSVASKISQKSDSKVRSRVRSRSSSRSRSRSRSRTRKQRSKASVDDSSDMDVISTARSETSDNQVCLSVATLKHLTKVHSVKLNIDQLQFGRPRETSGLIGKHKTSRPPRSQSFRKSGTYIVEYHFPMSGSSKPTATDYITVPSQKILNEVIVFGHTSVFPVVFDADTVEKWWRSALVFRLYHKDGHSPAALVGSGGISLKSILRSPDLSVMREIEIADSRRRDFLSSPKSSALDTSILSFGQLKVFVSLTANNDQSSHLEMFDANKDQHFVKSVEKTLDIPVSSKRVPKGNHMVAGLPPQSPRPRSHDKPETLLVKQQMKAVETKDEMSLQQADFATLGLQALLFVQEGSRISFNGNFANHMNNPETKPLINVGGQKSVICNSYIVCKMLWCKDASYSDVCWGTNNPNFNFLQVSPVMLTAPLLERFKDNYIIIEVWDKRVAANGDKLVGMVKLSLQQFFLSFRDRKIARTLLSSEYPVVAVDNVMPVVDPFSGLHVGQLKVLLAMGSEAQVLNLKTVALGLSDMHVLSAKAETPREDLSLSQHQQLVTDSETHEFELQIDGVTGLKLSDNMIWGEADCFIQFFFPAQDEDLKERMGCGSGLSSLKCYRTVTTLCTPEATFHDTSIHKLTLPVGVPVQRELLAACAKSGGSVSGLSFEVWCRYYQPNIRDQLIAKCSLPLAKLSAMITMHKTREQCIQAFSLKLSQVSADSGSHGVEAAAKNNSGTLNFAITYRKQLMHIDQFAVPANKAQDVCLSIGVLRACGLKSAAEYVAQFDPTMKYPADVGVNAYVRINISLFGKENEKVTKTIAKSFAPEFSHFMDMSCPLVVSSGPSASSRTSLAELLDSGVVTFEIWHQVSPSVYQENQYGLSRDGLRTQKLSQHTGDLLLGSSVVPLTALLSQRTGLNGWFPISIPSMSWEGSAADAETPRDSTLDQAVGGLELSVKFSHQDDLDRVVKAARNLGWSSFDVPPQQMDWQEGENEAVKHNITIAIDHVSFPLDLALIKGHAALNKAAKCYVRYKFYDKGAVTTKSGKLRTSDRGLLVSTLSHRRDFSLPHTAPLQWYLREEKLEIQAWLTFGRDQETQQKCRHRDRWLGSCYIDLESLTETRRGRQRVSGLFPIFKPGADNLKSAFIKADIVSRLSSSQKAQNSANQNICFDESESVTETEQSMEEVQLWAKNFTVDKTPTKRGENGDKAYMDTSFAVLMAVERAMHLPMVTERNRSGEVNPTTYVSYQSAERSKPTCTSVFPNSCNPLWDYAVETRLSTQHLLDSNKNLVLKVWHKPADAPKTPDKSCDKVLGFVSVDLGPLSKGLQQICGWYNILDFNGQCRGQIKVSITPQDSQQAGAPSASSFMLPPTFGTSSSSLLLDTHTHTVAEQLVSLQQQLKHWMASQTSKLFSDGDTNAASKSTALDSGDDKQDTCSIPTTTASEPRPRLDLKPVPDDTPTSYLFSSLRRQLEDLDLMTQKMKLRLSSTSDSDAGQPAINSGRSADILNGTYSGISTINTVSSLMNTREGYTNAESSENGASHELSQSQTMNASTLDFPTEVAEKPEQKSATRFLDSGVFSAKNFYDKSVDTGPESQRSGRSLSTEPPIDQDSSNLSIHKLSENHSGQTGYLEMEGHDKCAGKTQPFTPAGDSSETSGNSHGFMPDSQRANDTNTLTSLNFATVHSGMDMGKAGTSSDAVSTLESKQSLASGSVKSEQTVVCDEEEYAGDEDDDNKGQENSLYGSYHHYRALLDEEEDDGNDSDKQEIEGDVVEVIPRSLNNMSTVLALQANEPSGMHEEVLLGKEETTLPGAPNTDLHVNNLSYCSADNEDSFFQEVVFKNDRCLEEGQIQDAKDGERDDLDSATDQIQQLHVSDVESWLEKHMGEAGEDDVCQEGRDSQRTESTVQPRLNEAVLIAETGSQRSSINERKSTTLLSDSGEQDVRLELVDYEDERTGADTGAGVGVWRQDIQDSSDEETPPQIHAQKDLVNEGFDKDVGETAVTLTDLHLTSNKVSHSHPAADHMHCLSKVELENSSNSGESHRSQVSSARQESIYGNSGPLASPVDQKASLDQEHPSGFSYARNPEFEYPFTLELEDLNIGNQHRNGIAKGESSNAQVDPEDMSLPSPHGSGSQVSPGSDKLDQTEDSWGAREQSYDKCGIDTQHPEPLAVAEGAGTRGAGYGEAHVDSTIDSAYVDSDGCHPSSAGINTSSKAAGSFYSFVQQDDSGVGHLSRTLSGESNQLKLANFFMPAEDMKTSLRILQSANENAEKNLRAQQKVLAASQLVTKLAERKSTTTSTSVKNKRPPSAKEAKRIAKIFGSKAS